VGVDNSAAGQQASECAMLVRGNKRIIGVPALAIYEQQLQ